MAQALVALPLALTVLGGAASAGGSILSANADAKELNLQADQLSAQAGTERATAQRRAMEERRQARLVSSRALSLAAAGGGADDPSVVNNLANIAGEGEYRALTALYEGNDAAASMEADAAARRRGAKSVKTAGLIKAGTTILSTGASLFSRYG